MTGFFMELREPAMLMLREPLKWRPHESQSTDAAYWGGVVRISVEAAVMAVERRGGVKRAQGTAQLHCRRMLS